jgi:pheromone shutdown protein TraB
MQDTEGTQSSTIHRLEYNGKQILIIATAHVSKESQEEVKRVIEEEKPDSVCVELDEGRYKSITEKEKHSNMNIVQVIKEGKAMMVMANLFLSSFQRKIAAKMGVKPGVEMIQGIESAKEIGAELVLADRDIQVTFRRIWRKSTAGEKFKLLYQILGSLMVSEKELQEEDIEKMKSGDMLDNALSVMGETFPLIKEILIDERDIYLANKIKNAPGEKIVAVLGAGHVPGVKKMITQEQYSIPQTIPADKFERKINRKMKEADKEYLLQYYQKTETGEKPSYKLEKELNKDEEQKLHNILYNELPKKGIGGKIIGWGIPILILAWIISGFFTGGGWEGLLQNFFGYALGTGVGAALGAIVALSHPVTVLVGFAGAWLTVLHPILGIGMFTGLSEAHFKKPKVSDLENLSKDIQSFKGFYKNRFTHILLVIFLSSIGTMLGIIFGISLFTDTIIPYIANLLGF